MPESHHIIKKELIIILYIWKKKSKLYTYMNKLQQTYSMNNFVLINHRIINKIFGLQIVAQPKWELDVLDDIFNFVKLFLHCLITENSAIR